MFVYKCMSVCMFVSVCWINVVYIVYVVYVVHVVHVGVMILVKKKSLLCFKICIDVYPYDV